MKWRRYLITYMRVTASSLNVAFDKQRLLNKDAMLVAILAVS